MSKRYRVTIEGELWLGSKGAPFVGQRAYAASNAVGGPRAEQWWMLNTTCLVTAVEELPEPRTPEQERDAAIAALRELAQEPNVVLGRDVEIIAAKHGITL